MKFMDLCSGIGGFRTGLENNGHDCIAYGEIDKFAIQSYNAIYDTDGEENLNDITAVSDEHFRLYRGKCDIITGGFPCQAFSIAGNRRGFEDTRGTVFFHIARAVKQIQPSYILLENVRGLFSHDEGRTFGTIIQALEELGYITEWCLFNSKYWGVPQNRERIYILATRKDVFKKPKLFDLGKQEKEITTRLDEILEKDVDESYYLPKEKVDKLTVDYAKDESCIAIREATKQGYTVAKEGDSVNVSFPNSKTRRGRVGKQIAQTLQAGDVNQGVIINPLKDKTYKSWRYEQNVFDSKGIARSLKASLGGTPEILENNTGELSIRKLTPLECWRLQGFSDQQFYKAQQSGVSNSQLYKQAGNSVTVNVVDAIVKKIGGNENGKD